MSANPVIDGLQAVKVRPIYRLLLGALLALVMAASLPEVAWGGTPPATPVVSLDAATGATPTLEDQWGFGGFFHIRISHFSSLGSFAVSYSGQSGVTFKCYLSTPASGSSGVQSVYDLSGGPQLDISHYSPCGSSPVTVPMPTDGQYLFCVKAVNGSGDASFSSEDTDGCVAVVRDTVAPTQELSLDGPTSETVFIKDVYGLTDPSFQRDYGEATFVYVSVDSGEYRKIDWAMFQTLFDFTYDLPEGPHALSFKLCDAAMNCSDVQGGYAFTLDKTPPDYANFLSSPRSFSNSTSVTFEFGGEEGATFMCHLDSPSNYENCGSTKVFDPIAEGDHDLYVKQVDRAGNESGVSGVQFTVDRTAPSAPGLTGAPASFTTSTGASIGYTGERNAWFRCSLDGAAYGNCGTSPKVLSSLADGVHTLAVTQTDPAGNVSTAATATWTVDRTAPSAPGLTGAPASFTSSTGASVGFSGEANASFTCSVDGGSYTACGSSPKVLSSLADGAHSLAVKQTDQAGNVSPAATASWTVDTTSPAEPLLSGAPSGTSSSTGASIGFSGEANASFTCSVDGGSYTACGSSPKVLSSLADGAHSLAVKQTDQAGNVSPAATASWTVLAVVADTTPPTTPGSFTGVPSSRTSNTTATIGFALGESGGTVECRLDSGSWVTCTSVSGTSGSMLLTGLSEGSHSLSVRQTDAAGNVSATGTSSTWTVDRTAPAAPILSGAPSGSTTSTSASISFSGEAGATFTCSVDGGSYATCGSSPKVLSGLAVGAHSLSVKATDAAGNVSSAGSASWTVASEPTSPPAILTPPAGTRTVYRKTVDGASTWAIKTGLLFSTGGDTRGSAQFLTVQVAVDSAGKPVSTKPSDTLAPPTSATFANGVIAWSSSGEVTRSSSAAPVWVRVGNRVGKWSVWVKLTA